MIIVRCFKSCKRHYDGAVQVKHTSLTLGAHAHSEGYCSCPVCVCMYVCPLIPAASHIAITKERYQRIHHNTEIVFNFANFPKNALFKSYGVMSLPRAAPAS